MAALVFCGEVLLVRGYDRTSYLLPLLRGYACSTRTGTSLILSSTGKRMCMLRCMSDPDCVAINYKKGKDECKLALDACLDVKPNEGYDLQFLRDRGDTFGCVEWVRIEESSLDETKDTPGDNFMWMYEEATEEGEHDNIFIAARKQLGDSQIPGQYKFKNRKFFSRETDGTVVKGVDDVELLQVTCPLIWYPHSADSDKAIQVIYNATVGGYMSDGVEVYVARMQEEEGCWHYGYYHPADQAAHANSGNGHLISDEFYLLF